MYRPENRFPERIQQLLADSDVQLADREVKLTIGLLHGAHEWAERRWFKGALAVTATHLIAYVRQVELLYVPLHELQKNRVEIQLDNPACFSVSMQRAPGHPAMELRFYTPAAERYVALLMAG